VLNTQHLPQDGCDKWQLYTLFLLINSNTFLKHGFLCKWHIPSVNCNEHIQGNNFTQSQLLVTLHQVTYTPNSFTSYLPHCVSQQFSSVCVSSAVPTQIYMSHMLNTVATQSAVINSDDNFPMCHFHTQRQFTNRWNVYEQKVSFQTVREHAEVTYLMRKKLDEIHDKNRRQHQQHFWYTLHIRDVSMLLLQNALNCCLCNHTRQLSFTNFMIYSKILLIQHLIIWKSWQFGTWVVHRPEILLFTKKKLHQWNMQISGTCSRRPPVVSVHQTFWYHNSLSLIPLTSSALKTPENT
jgi:hypothetical protein